MLLIFVLPLAFVLFCLLFAASVVGFVRGLRGTVPRRAAPTGRSRVGIGFFFGGHGR